MRDRTPERIVHRYLMLPSTFDEYLRKHKGLVAKLKKFEKAFRDRYEYRLLTREDEIDGFCEERKPWPGRPISGRSGSGS